MQEIENRSNPRALIAGKVDRSDIRIVDEGNLGEGDGLDQEYENEYS